MLVFAVVTGIVVTLASTGPLISFYALSVWWSVATTLLAAAGIAFLYLAGWTDPGYLEQFSDRDPLIDILVEQSRPALQNTRSVRIRVEYEGETYVRYLQDGSWVKLEPGVHISATCSSPMLPVVPQTSQRTCAPLPRPVAIQHPYEQALHGLS